MTEVRLIDADALKEEIEKALDNAELSEYEACICVTSIYDKCIDNAPTVDLKDIYQEGHYDGQLEGYTRAINEEKPQGEWIWVQYDANPNIGNWHCSGCHYIPHGKKEYQRTNFCPNCGADMKGGAE